MGHRVAWPLAALLLAAVPLALGAPNYLLYVLTMGGLYALLAQSWSLLARSGLVSFGHAAFFGVGAYTYALLALKAGWATWGAWGTAGVAAGLYALVVAWTGRDLRGPYFSLTTFAHAEILRAVARNWTDLTEGEWGLVNIPSLAPVGPGGGIDPSSHPGAYLLILVLVLALTAALAALSRSSWGLALDAVRQGEERASSLGIDAGWLRLAALAASGACAGLGGAFYAQLFHFIDPSIAFSLSFTILPMVMALVGGLLAPLGPVCGAVALSLADELLFHPLLPSAHLLLYAGAILLALVCFPRGWVPPRHRARDAAA